VNHEIRNSCCNFGLDLHLSPAKIGFDYAAIEGDFARWNDSPYSIRECGTHSTSQSAGRASSIPSYNCPGALNECFWFKVGISNMEIRVQD
jgi:hypothetical protein